MLKVCLLLQNQVALFNIVFRFDEISGAVIITPRMT